nr:GGDEF domain-containing protein [uncultured Desulfuromonas sp.]
MKLRDFFILLFVLLIVAILVVNYCVYRSDKELVLSYLSDWSRSAMLQTETPVVDLLNRGKVSSVQKLLDRAFVSRPFLSSISISLDEHHYTLSSDRSLQGKELSGKFQTVSGPLTQQITRGGTHFRLPITYYLNGLPQQGLLLMVLDEDYVFNEIKAHALRTSGRILTIAALIFAFGCWLAYHFLIAPIANIRQFVNEGACRKHHFLIEDFSQLMQYVQHSFSTLAKQKQQIQDAFDYECYLESILQTVADINKLLIVSKTAEELLQRSCERLAQHGDYAYAWIGEIREQKIHVLVQSADCEGVLPGDFSISLEQASVESSAPIAKSVLTNQTQVINDLEKETSITSCCKKALQAGFKTLISLPLCADSYSKPFGVLVIFTHSTRGFDPKEVEMLNELAGDIGFAATAFKKERDFKAYLSTDALSGLANRSVLLDSIKRIEEPEIMVLSINDFKNINEVYGFELGDALIQEFSRVLQEFVAPYRQVRVYSLGVDNFALLLSEGHRLDMNDFADLLVTTLENHPYTCFGIEIVPEITAGYARSHEQVVERAELALKWAKSQKKKLGVFDPTQLMVEEHQNNMQWYYTVHKAIHDKRIIPYFQGIVDNRTGAICKYETLMRLQLPNGNIVTPFHFLAIAKKTRLYPELTRIMVRKAFAAFADSTVPICFNISLEDIVNDQVVETLRQEVLHHKMGGRITFEILESEGIRDYETVAAFIREFKALGCQIAIDDFGSGYSNFEHLLNLQVDYLKIDGSLIQNIVHDHNAQVLVQHIHHLATDLNMQTIAEFVSSQEIYDKLQELGITYSQGYHFHQPQPFEKLPLV